LSSPYPCPVCGYGLRSPAEDFTICPSCGIEFGYSDEGVSHAELRREWIRFECPWSSTSIPEPQGWNPYEQLIGSGFGRDIPWMNKVKVEVKIPTKSRPVPQKDAPFATRQVSFVQVSFA